MDVPKFLVLEVGSWFSWLIFFFGKTSQMCFVIPIQLLHLATVQTAMKKAPTCVISMLFLMVHIVDHSCSTMTCTWDHSLRFCFVLLGQWLNFKLFGITYLVGKIKFTLLFQGPLAKWVVGAGVIADRYWCSPMVAVSSWWVTGKFHQEGLCQGDRKIDEADSLEEQNRPGLVRAKCYSMYLQRRVQKWF